MIKYLFRRGVILQWLTCYYGIVGLIRWCYLACCAFVASHICGWEKERGCGGGRQYCSKIWLITAVVHMKRNHSHNLKCSEWTKLYQTLQWSETWYFWYHGIKNSLFFCCLFFLSHNKLNNLKYLCLIYVGPSLTITGTNLWNGR